MVETLRPVREWLGRFSLAALLGALLGFSDYLVFEAFSQHSTFVESALAKPAFWGLSYFSWQVLAFSALSCLFFTGCSVLLIFRVFRKHLFFLDSFVSLSVLVCSLMIVALRYLKNSSETVGVLTLIVCSAVLVVLPFAGSLSSRFTKRRRCLISYRIQSVILATIFLISFLAPDLYSKIAFRDLKPMSQNADHPNVILLVLDTLRADHLSCYGYPRRTTPSIDALAREGILFSNAYSTAPWTVPSHASMFTGLQTSEHHADWGSTYLDQQFLTLAEYLEENSYLTAGFSENPFVGKSSGFARGFGEFHEIWRRPMLIRGIVELLTLADVRKERQEYSQRTASLVRRWIAGKQKISRPFFVYVNFMAAHLPRYPRSSTQPRQWPTGALRRIEPVNLVPERYYLPQYHLDNDLLAVVTDIYDQEVEYLDKRVGELIHGLEADGFLENTVVIITSDHGENLGDHGLFEHQFCLYNSLIKVPLVLIYRDHLEPKVVHANVSTVSIFCTIVTLALGPEAVPPSMRHQVPLHQVEMDQVVYSEYSNGISMLRSVLGEDSETIDLQRFDRSFKSVIAERTKYVVDSAGGREFFDLSKDPSESKNLIAQRPAVLERLEALLTSGLNPFGVPTRPLNPPHLDEGTRDALQKLGYIP